MTDERWRPGMPLTQEMKDKRAATMRAGGRKKKGARPSGRAVPSRPRGTEPAPRRQAVAGMPAKMVGKIEELVGGCLGLVEGGIVWGARRVTYEETREVEVAAKEPGGPPEIALEKTGRTFPAFDDATLEADKLEAWERDELAIALTAEMLRYPRLRALLIKLVEMQDRTTLPMILTLIALPRLIRHGRLPAEFEQFVEAARETARKKHAEGRGARAIDEPAPAPPSPSASSNGQALPPIPDEETLERELAASRVAPVAP